MDSVNLVAVMINAALGLLLLVRLVKGSPEKFELHESYATKAELKELKETLNKEVSEVKAELRLMDHNSREGRRGIHDELRKIRDNLVDSAKELRELTGSVGRLEGRTDKS